MDEFDLIQRFFARASDRTLVGIGDDAAIIQTTPGTETYIAVDTLVAGIHFPPSTPAESVGFRALAVNLSDLAAMAARPRWFTLAISLPEVDPVWLADFSDGLFRLADDVGMDLIGGDTTEGPLAITVQVIGESPQGKRLLRSGARPNDGIYISGSPGDAAAGLAQLLKGDAPATPAEHYLQGRFLWPTARLELGVSLRESARAAIDISDGLLADLDHLLEASSVGAIVELERLPLSPELREYAGNEFAEQYALTGGDDYELCFTAPTEAVSNSLAQACTRIGTIVEGNQLQLQRNGNVVPLPDRLGYRHLRSGQECL